MNAGPESVHHLRARHRGFLSVAVEWGRVAANPASGRLRSPKRHHTRKRRILLPNQLGKLVLLLKSPHEVIEWCWRHLRPCAKVKLRPCAGMTSETTAITVDEASYFGTLGTPKSDKSNRRVAIVPAIHKALKEWRRQARFTESDDFVFVIRTNTPIDLHNAAPRHLKPGCRQLVSPRYPGTTFGTPIPPGDARLGSMQRP